MFDFPNSPALNDVYSAQGVAWQYDGEKWKGGLPATQSDTQWIDMSGKSQVDLVVPTWARLVQLDGSVFQAAANAQIGVQISTDGSTFYTANYAVGGPYHESAGGASAYKTQAQVTSASMVLGWGVDNLAVATNFNGLLNLTISAPGSQIYSMRATSTSYIASGGLRTQSILSYYNATPSAASVKLIRLINTGAGGAYLAPSYVKVTWLGDLNALPQSGAIVDAPSDGAEYVRINGVWRKKCETFTWTASRSVAVFLCPPGATRVRAVAFISNPAVSTLGQFGFQGSQDGGATFNSVANSYYFSGLACDGGTAAASSIGVQPSTWGYLGWQTNNTSVGNHVTADICLARPASGSTWTFHAVGGGYHDTASILQRTWVINGYLSAGWGAGPINALQFFNANSTMLSGSIECTWGYG